MSQRSTNDKSLAGGKTKKKASKKNEEGSIVFNKFSMDSDAFNDQEDINESREPSSYVEDEESYYYEEEESKVAELQPIDESSFENYDGGTVSMYTLRQLIKKEKPFISLNLMIQTEYCSG